MTREETLAAISVMQAWCAGKKVEFRNAEGHVWKTCLDPLWDHMNCRYRIAPEPRVRPWRLDESEVE